MAALENGQSLAVEGGITGFGLKLVALIAMFIDHIGAVVLERFVWGHGMDPAAQARWISIYNGTRLIGRIAFPIYCFLLVEGFLHTGNRAKYAVRLFVFALLSEIPFDLAVFDTAFDWEHQNVFFTLLLGLLALWGLEEIGKRMQAGIKPIIGKLMVFGVIAGCGLAAEYVLCSDYGVCGVICIVIMYRMHDRNPLLGYILSVILMAAVLNIMELGALAVAPLIWAYNGRRGHGVKYLFYAFYPVHLLLLALFCMANGL